LVHYLPGCRRAFDFFFDALGLVVDDEPQVWKTQRAGLGAGCSLKNVMGNDDGGNSCPL
jgi:hypothetical protein